MNMNRFVPFSSSRFECAWNAPLNFTMSPKMHDTTTHPLTLYCSLIQFKWSQGSRGSNVPMVLIVKLNYLEMRILERLFSDKNIAKYWTDNLNSWHSQWSLQDSFNRQSNTRTNRTCSIESPPELWHHHCPIRLTNCLSPSLAITSNLSATGHEER